MPPHFSQSDREQFKKLGITPGQIQSQLDLFAKGPPRVTLQAPCTVGKGIRVFSGKELQELDGCFEQAQRQGRAMQFIPASGAASRMFRELHRFLQSTGPGPTDPQVAKFFQNLDQFPFTPKLLAHLQQKGLRDLKIHPAEGRKLFVRELLESEGLNFENLPKGMIPFHAYPGSVRTAFEEHLVEAAQLVRDAKDRCRIHFTVRKKQEKRIREFFGGVLPKFEKDGIRFILTFSVQKHSTDTLAVDLDNQPFRLKDGRLLFRPAGHGALLENLNECGGDIVFIRNIDNVSSDPHKPLGLKYRRAMGGLLVRIQEKIFDYLKRLEGDAVTPALLEETAQFFRHQFGGSADAEHPEKLIRQLSRPLRVCAMVPHHGEAGGGPFWVKDTEGSLSLQIVESAQVDRQDPAQIRVFRRSTHFNPVDMVCALKNVRGENFDLTGFRDEGAVFISRKSHGGRPLKALELPGLWNGSMADWNTVFVEVPVKTFAPVKTVLDLLRPEHQSGFGD